jgi:hypothetical protein
LNHYMDIFFYCKELYLICSFFLFPQQKTRIERVIGFFLAIWGILFYSRLLSAMTEQFRVSFISV